MMRSKKFRTISILVLLAGLALIAWWLNKGQDNSKLADEALSDFAVKDTAAIDKLILNDTEGNPGVTLIRTANGWTTDKDICVQQHLVNTMLETIRHVTVKGLVPKDAIETVNKNLTTHHKKLEIFVQGELVKTWYIGNPSPDHYGTYMLLKDPEKGKSPEPFIMHMPNEHGSLQSRFITNPNEMECSGIFNYDPLDVKSIDVKQPDSSHLNFKIVANDENNFSLFNNQKSIANFDTTRVRSYILYYKKVHYESHNSLLNAKQVDSLKLAVPYFTIEVTNKKDESKKIALYKKRFVVERYGYDGKLLQYDQDRLWVVLPDGRLVVGQYHVFDKLLRDIRYFDKNTPAYQF
ncbi:MAG: hypothetical protein IPM74_08770 [Crocinitomicaceae bacterium]|nr:hypothetical protein [Crocinitomicaceae bacterium]MBK8925982.1 hypothetical protein [Crocinitomicaceae bacterium]